MSDDWFEQFVYQVVVPKSIAPKELVKVFEGEERIVLPPWDPMVRCMCDFVFSLTDPSMTGLACVRVYMDNVSLCTPYQYPVRSSLDRLSSSSCVRLSHRLR
jgi:hypothetical protein